jgi:hypothetical protein
MGDQPGWNYGPNYSPGQFAFNNNAELSQLISMFSGMALPGLIGPGNFMPTMYPAQGAIDQFARKQFQEQQRASAFNVSTDNDADVATRFLGMRSLFTQDPISDNNRAQAAQLASLVNSPFTKGAVGMMIGPENLEAMLHGRKGDVSALNTVVNRIGYHRQDPSGAGRMDASSMEDFSRGMYSHLYEGGGDFKAVEQMARQGDEDSQQRLKKEARMAESMKLISDEQFADTLTADTSDANTQRVSDIYKKHIAGDETDTRKQAEAIARFDPAAREAKVLKEDEATFTMATNAARRHQVAGVNGLMASQVGQVAEQMFQRGMLPQSIGALSPAERAKIVGAQEIDEPTMTRLAREFGHRELMETDTNYRNDPTAREKILTARDETGVSKLDQFKIRLDASLHDIRNAGAGATSADLDKIEGADLLTGNVDAKRSADAVKKYTGAVAAVREIFGDSGNTNAPMPALLAALDHLSHGASMQMDPKKIEASLRQMQMLAKESGVGFQQLAALSAQMGAMGDALGVSKQATMQNQVAVLAGIKTMRDTGSFAKPMFGAMSQEEAGQMMAQNLQRGDASDNARTMAAMASIYAADPKAFDENSEFAQAMKAYNDPSANGVYTFNGQEKNLFEFAGQHGARGLSRMAQEAGVSQSELSAAFSNPATREYMQAGAGYQTQKYQMLRDIGNMAVYGPAESRLRDATTKNPGGALAGADTRQTAAGVSQAMSSLLLESADKNQNDQVKYVQEQLVDTLKTDFKKRLGITDDAKAQKMAEEAATAVIGTGDEQKRKILEFRNNADATIAHLSGGQLSMRTMWQMVGQGRDVKTAEEKRRAGFIAERKAEVGLDFGSHPLARVADYLFDVGRAGGKVDSGDMAKAFFHVVPDAEMRSRYMEGMEGGLNALNELAEGKTHTTASINELAAKAKGGHKESIQQLRRLGRVSDKKTIISDEKLVEERNKRVDAILNDDAKLDEAYASAVGKKTEDVKDVSRTDKQKHLRDLPSFVQQQTNVVLGTDTMTQSQLAEQAVQLGAGEAIDPRNETAAANLKAVWRSVMQGDNPDVMNAGIKAALDLIGVKNTKNDKTGKTRAEELQALISNTDPRSAEAKKKLQEYVTGNLGITDEKKLKQAQGVFETQRVGSALAIDKTIGQASQNINTANIEAAKVTINASSVDGAAGSALPGTPASAAGTSAATSPAAPTTAHDATPATPSTPAVAAPTDTTTPAPPSTATAPTPTPAADAAASAQASAASEQVNRIQAQTPNIAPANPIPAPTAPADAAGSKEMTLKGELRLVDAQKVILDVVAERDGRATPGGGGPVRAVSTSRT